MNRTHARLIQLITTFTNPFPLICLYLLRPEADLPGPRMRFRYAASHDTTKTALWFDDRRATL